ncbi:metal ABC transporter permease [Aestuariivirga sp.]|jgi:zinc transport system permease protein|uniref:metal ABC transporter permease n=1 Tax=Aestuariivirga sp. TaxID=2650926 RepID=UPI0037845BAB
MPDILAEPFFQRALLAGLAIASVAGPVGCFIVWRRMAYFGETLAHSGLFGVGLGLLLGFSLTLGAAASAVAVALLLGLLRKQRFLATDTLLGILSHGSLALGILTVGLVTGATGDHLDLLFGDILTVSWQDVSLVWAGAAAVLLLLSLLWRDLIAISVHEELAEAEGIQVRRVELGFVILIALMTAVAMKIVGLLLITALLVIPAAAARRLSNGPEAMAMVAAGLACAAVVLGLVLSAYANAVTGPAIVLSAAFLFVLTLLRPQAN